MIPRTGKPGFRLREHTIIGNGQSGQQAAKANGMAATNNADFPRGQRPALRLTFQQLRHAAAQHPAAHGGSRQGLRCDTALVRRGQRHDATGPLLRIIMMQRADQDATQAVAYQMHLFRRQRGEIALQAFGIRTQV